MGFGIDAEGEGWTSKVFTLEGEGPGAVASVLSGLWEFYTEFARLASIEFRLVIASAGPMSKAEIDSEYFIHDVDLTDDSVARSHRQNQNTSLTRRRRITRHAIFSASIRDVHDNDDSAVYLR